MYEVGDPVIYKGRVCTVKTKKLRNFVGTPYDLVNAGGGMHYMIYEQLMSRPTTALQVMEWVCSSK